MKSVRLAIFVVAICVPIAPIAAQSPTLASTLYLYKLPQMDTVAVGDLTGDGVPDLTTGGLTARGRGDGTFGTPFESGPGGHALATGDFNRDGRLDLLVRANGFLDDATESTYILPGRGDGTFGTPLRGPYGETDFAVVVDLDADGILDVAINGAGEFEGSNIKIFRGNSDGAFSYVNTFAGAPIRGAAGDVNNDGHTDLVFANYTHSLTILLNQGAMTFRASEIVLGDSQIYDISLARLDVDNANIDLVVLSDNPAGGVAVLLGRGDGTFGLPTRLDTGIKGPSAVTVSDFTRDGIPDVAVGNQSAEPDDIFGLQLWDSVTILRGNGTGAFGSPTTFALGSVNQSDEPYANSIHRVRAHDLNRDGHVDLVGSPGAVLLNAPVQTNRKATVFAGLDITQTHNQPIYLRGQAADPDNHWLQYRWTDSDGRSVGSRPFVAPFGTSFPAPGTYTYTLTVDDGFGGVASDSVIVDVKPASMPAVTLTTPYAGETVPVDGTYLLQWDADASSTRFDLAYSWNGGRGWVPIEECTGLGGTARECAWQDPGPASNDALIRIVAVYGGGQTWTAYSPRFSTVIGSRTSLPPEWTHIDIGDVAPAGNATFDGSTYTVQGSGADIWGFQDAFHFAYTRVSGDVTIVARVIGVQNVDQWTKAGIMIRDQALPDSRHASIFATPTTLKGVAFQRRWYTGDTSVHTAGPAVAPPVWLRLSRQGNTFTASYRLSPTAAWTLIGTDVFEMSRGVLVGVAVTSHSTGRLANATFDNVTINGPDESNLPAGWSKQDVGSVATAGNTTFDGQTYTLKGSGADIWGTADEFHFAYTARPGEVENYFEVTARVTGVQNVSEWTKAGIMIRSGTSASAAHASLFVTPTTVKGIAFQRRPSDGAASVHSAGGPFTAPIWLKLVVSSTGVKAFYRNPNGEWLFIAQDAIALGANPLVGLAVSSHVDGTLATATFDNVSIRAFPSWSGQDIGAVAIAGGVDDDGARKVMSASGEDIWNSADAFHFYSTDTAPRGLSARVLQVENVHPWTKAGIMIRDNLSPGSPHVMLIVTPGKGIALQYRTQQDGATVQGRVAETAAAPKWIRLTRTGGYYVAEASNDGLEWAEFVRIYDQFTIRENSLAGLVLTSHDNTRTAFAVFDDVVIAP
jgi:hypothetical protein